VGENGRGQHCPYYDLQGVDQVHNEIVCAKVENITLDNFFDVDQQSAGKTVADPKSNTEETCLPRPAYRNVEMFLKQIGEEIKKGIDEIDDDNDKALAKHFAGLEVLEGKELEE